MRIAVIGKSAFGADVFRKLIEDGHNVVVACTELDKNGRADLLGNLDVIKFKRVFDF